MTHRDKIKLQAIEFEVPEGCEGKKIDDHNAIIILDGDPTKKIYVDIAQYNKERCGNFYNEDIEILSRDIYVKIGVDPFIKMWSYSKKRKSIKEINWERYQWYQHQINQPPEIDVWLNQLNDSLMCRVMTCLQDGVENPKIVNLIRSIHP